VIIINKSLKIATISILTATAITIRVAKNWTIGSFQFINVALIFGFIGSIFLDSLSGGLIALLSQLISDLLIWPGPWTPITSLTAFVTAILGSLSKRVKYQELQFIILYLCVFLYDIVTSALTYLISGLSPINSLVVGLIGLFLPVEGGWMFGVGPITEFTTSFLTVILMKILKRNEFNTMQFIQN
jgi:energy-coupling factor transport system substrate-specific component